MTIFQLILGIVDEWALVLMGDYVQGNIFGQTWTLPNEHLTHYGTTF
jgi:hypothetical protein